MIFNLYTDTPAIVYGPTGAGAHAPNEFVEIDGLVACTTALALTILGFGQAVVPSTLVDGPHTAAASPEFRHRTTARGSGRPHLSPASPYASSSSDSIGSARRSGNCRARERQQPSSPNVVLEHLRPTLDRPPWVNG
jgi:hypothetical protein